MTLPKSHIANGPGQRDLELAFVGRNLGAAAKFRIYIADKPMVVTLRILNLAFVSAHGPNYKLGGQLIGLSGLSHEDQKKLPAFNWIFVDYNCETKQGTMEFSNAE